MRTALLFKTLRDRWRSALMWALGLTAIASIQLYIYPSVKTTAKEMDAFIASFPDFFSTMFRIDDYSSGPGFLGTELFSMMVPLIFISVGASFAAAAAAEEEERGTSELMYSLPVRRWQVLATKLLAGLLVLIFEAVIIFSTIRIGSEMVDLTIGTENLVAVTVSCLLLGVVFHAVAAVFATFTGHRAVGLGAAIALALVSFLFYSLAPLVDTFDVMLPFNPFHWALGQDPLRNGFDLSGLGWLALCAAALYVLSMWAISKRDIRS